MVSSSKMSASEWHNRNLWLLFAARFIRMASYGALTNVLLRYFTAVGLSAADVGIVLTGILLGDLGITLFLTTQADSIGRVKVLVIGSCLKAMAGITFARATSFYWLLLAGIVGVISPAGGEVGPFLATEQAALTDVIIRTHMVTTSSDESNDHNSSFVQSSPEVTSRVAEIFGWYNALGYAALAAGNTIGGEMVQYLQEENGELFAFKMMFYLYASMAAVMAVLYKFLSAEVEAESVGIPLTHSSPAATSQRPLEWYFFGLRSRSSFVVVRRLSLLFAMDAFAGGFAMQTAIVVWLAERWNFKYAEMGLILSAANLASGISTISSGYFVKWLGAVPVMVYTHLPSNILLILVPLMPTARSAVLMLVLRFSISQMDVPARQAYVSTVVSSYERSAAGGITNVIRSLGLALAPFPLAYLQSKPPMSLAFSSTFFICGGIKCIYDITLYVAYVLAQKPQEAISKPAEERSLLEKDTRNTSKA
jgi:MFS family permease